MDIRSVILENDFDSASPEELQNFFESLLLLHYGKEVEMLLVHQDTSKSYSLPVEFAMIVEGSVPVGTLLLADPSRMLPIFNASLLSAQEKLREHYARRFMTTGICILDRFIQKPTGPSTTKRPNQSNPPSQNSPSPAHPQHNFKQPKPPISIQLGQLVVKEKCAVRVHSLPDYREAKRSSLPRSSDYGMFVEFRGTVVRAVAPKVLEKTKEFACLKCGHRFDAQIDFEQQNNFSLPKKCPNPDKNCVASFFKPSEARGVHCDYQEIKIQEQIHHLAAGSIPRSIVVLLQDDLVDSCQAGDDLTVSGVVARRWSPIRNNDRPDLEMVLVANHIRIMNEQKHNEGLTEELRSIFEDYWMRYDNSPLEGRDKIIRQVCQGVCGMFVVKLALLLVVIGGVPVRDKVNGTNRRGECHMLLVGEPGTGKSQFLKFATKIASRSVLTTGIGTTSAGLTAAAVNAGGGEMALEAGALVLADGGVCCIDEFSGISSSDSATIHEAMEQQTISIAKASIVTTLHTRTSIIAATNAKGKYDPEQSLMVNTNLGTALLSRFDIIMIITDEIDDEWDRYLSDFILNQAMNINNTNPKVPKLDGDEALWNIETIQSYVHYVKSAFQPMFSQEARQLITLYYEKQRGSADRNEARVTTRLLESLVRLAQAHARLMFRNVVEVQDSIMAIYLLECCAESACILTNLNPQKSVHPEDPDAAYRLLENAIKQNLGLSIISTTTKQKRQKSNPIRPTHTTNSNWANNDDDDDDDDDDDEEQEQEEEVQYNDSGWEVEEEEMEYEEMEPLIQEVMQEEIQVEEEEVPNNFAHMEDEIFESSPPKPPIVVDTVRSNHSSLLSSHLDNSRTKATGITNTNNKRNMESQEKISFEQEFDKFQGDDATVAETWEDDDDNIEFSPNQSQIKPTTTTNTTTTTKPSLISTISSTQKQPISMAPNIEQDNDEELDDLDWND
ncbi:MCM family protein [Cavenderia fasciculata]|uniref:DNA helicase n=1 Tax=Cavenderia fasciculata TaxID=261658 RepID=F4PM02_CACFS|nr:MCM family protein [Cavenderia fasciculata]EGG22705.1 MCM family protein [Cavenderia fasciculata]|eukprot:XP_004360556.1 MCM family protein [Cavenderia fasciculata]